MNKKLQAALITVMISLSNHLFCQTNELGSEKNKPRKITEKTYLDLLLNVVSTNFNYGNSNSAFTDYKKPVLGAQVGISFQAGITPDFSLVSELYFIMKGGKLKENNPLTANAITHRLYTAEVPVLGRFHIGKFYLNAGPSLAYNFYGTRKMDDLSAHLSFKNTSEGFKRLDAGIQMGGGFMFNIKQKRVALDVRYCYGVTNISYDRKIYNRSLLISIHFSAPWKTNPLGKKRHS